MEAENKAKEPTSYIGKPVRRVEDARFLRGQGNYVDDSAYADAAHAVFVRSPHAHARIVGIDEKNALEMPGVLAVLTGRDWEESGLGHLPCLWQIDFSDGRPMNEIPRPVLAVDKVCHVGDTVAVIVSETVAQARDAADLLLVEYEPLPAVADTAAAVEPDAALVHPHLKRTSCSISNWPTQNARPKRLPVPPTSRASRWSTTASRRRQWNLVQ